MRRLGFALAWCTRIVVWLAVPCIAPAAAPANPPGAGADLPPAKVPAVSKYGVFWLRFSPDGQFLAWADDKGVGLWDVSAGKMAGTVERIGAGLCAFSKDGKRLALWLIRRDLKARAEIPVYDVPTLAPVRTLVHDGANAIAGDAPIGVLGFSRDGNTLLTAAGTGHQWDLRTGKHLRTFGPPQIDATRSVVSADARWLIVAGGGSLSSPDGALADVVNLSGGPDVKITLKAGPKEPAVFSRSFNSWSVSSDGKTLMAAENAKSTLCAWSLPGGKLISRRAFPSLDSFAMSADATRLLIGQSERKARAKLDLMQSSDAHVVRTLVMEQDVARYALSPDARYAAGSDIKGNLLLWDLGAQAATGKRGAK